MASAPTAIRSPISRVRSVTETSMMFMMPTPPTTSETAATAMPRPESMWIGLLQGVGDLGIVVDAEVGLVLGRSDAGRGASGVISLAGPGNRLRRLRLDHDLLDAFGAHAVRAARASARPATGRAGRAPASPAGGPPGSPPLMRYLTVVQGAKRMSSWSMPSRLAPFSLSTPITVKGTFLTRISSPMG